MSLNDNMVEDEIARIYAEPNYSEFEFAMIGEIAAWSLNHPNECGNHQDMVNAFWSEKLPE